jgi:hypothetical protein
LVYFLLKQEVLGRTNRFFSFDETQHKKRKKLRGHTAHRQQSDLISLLTNIKEGCIDKTID